jgi:hypothetical protein
MIQFVKEILASPAKYSNIRIHLIIMGASIVALIIFSLNMPVISLTVDWKIVWGLLLAVLAALTDMFYEPPDIVPIFTQKFRKRLTYILLAILIIVLPYNQPLL